MKYSFKSDLAKAQELSHGHEKKARELAEIVHRLYHRRGEDSFAECECSEKGKVQEQLLCKHLHVYSRRYCLSVIEMVAMWEFFSNINPWEDLGLLRDRAIRELEKESRESRDGRKPSTTPLPEIKSSAARKTPDVPDVTNGAPDRPTMFFMTNPLKQYRSALENAQTVFSHPLVQQEICEVVRTEFTLLSKKAQLRLVRELAKRLGMRVESAEKAFS